jgi:hypothetical protein
LARLWQFLFGHPLVKGIGLALLGILGNVLSGAYVFDITKSDAKLGQYLDWHATPHSPAFWGLVAVAVTTGFYVWGIARAETITNRDLTEADIRARILGDLIGPMLIVLKKDIRSGKLEPSDEFLNKLGIVRKPQ